MKAPDKIYMPNELLSEEWCRHIEGQDTEYIRKEALLEWLKEKVEWFKGTDIAPHYQKVIDKLNSM